MTDNYAKRRAACVERLGDAGALIIAAAPEIVVGRDTELRYQIDAELYYLTGYTEPEAVLVLCPGNVQAPFAMFVRPRDAARELWTGERGGIEAARELFGADVAFPIAELPQRLPALTAHADVLYARTGNGRADVDAAIVSCIAQSRRVRARTGRGPHTLTDPGVLLDEMRVIKDAHELELMREAARISCQAFVAAIQRVEPGVGEWQVEAELEYGFRSRRGDGPAFPTIAAAGVNATVLHYISNDCVARDGDLLLLDAGARYRMYCADITRTIPVSGKFTPMQKDVYDVVLAAHDAAIAATRAGVSFEAPHEAVARVLARGLLDLRLMTGSVESVLADERGLRAVFPHRTSHWLGLEVHDVGAYASPHGPLALRPGMVLTIEPGLYLKEHKIGIRIEDDVLVTPAGCEVLTDAVPLQSADIEELMTRATA